MDCFASLAKTPPAQSTSSIELSPRVLTQCMVRPRVARGFYRSIGLATAAYIAEPPRVAGRVVALNEAEIELRSAIAGAVAGHAYDLDAEERREGSGRRFRRLTAARPVVVVGKKPKHQIEQLHRFCDIDPAHWFDRFRSQ
jgi:hypothetical protein